MYLASGQELLHCNLIKLLFKNILECHFLPDLPYASTLSNSESVALDLIWNRSPPRIKNSRQYRYMPSESVLVCHVWFSARCWPATQEDCTLKMVSVPQECHENMCFISLAPFVQSLVSSLSFSGSRWIQSLLGFEVHEHLQTGM